MRAVLSKADEKIRPASSQLVTPPGGGADVFRIEFTAPSPLTSVDGTRNRRTRSLSPAAIPAMVRKSTNPPAVLASQGRRTGASRSRRWTRVQSPAGEPGTGISVMDQVIPTRPRTDR